MVGAVALAGALTGAAVVDDGTACARIACGAAAAAAAAAEDDAIDPVPTDGRGGGGGGTTTRALWTAAPTAAVMGAAPTFPTAAPPLGVTAPRGR